MNQTELDKAITQRLVRGGHVQAPLVERAQALRASRRMTLTRALVELKLVSGDTLAGILEEVTGASSIDPSFLTVYPDYIEAVNKLIPKAFVVRALVFPVQSELNTIRIGMLNPTDREMISALEALSGCRVEAFVGQEQHLAAAISKHYDVEISSLPEEAVDTGKAQELVNTLMRARASQDMEALIEPAVTLVNRNRDKLANDPAALEEIVRDSNVIRLVHEMLSRLVDAGASDVHFEPLQSAFRVRSRVDGAMRVGWTLPPALALPCIARIKLMADLPMGASSQPLDARISYDLVWGRDVDFRFSSLPSLYGEKIVLRALDRSRKRQELTELGFDDETLSRVRSVAEGPNGLILVTGPTGSGKTSTLYALVDHLNDDDVNIVSAEDPVESRIDGVTQVHCGDDTGVGFVEALRSFLRQDPDVILVGEIRDQETADIALKAALTGHLVMSTLHTNDAASTILRLLNMNLDPFIVGAAVRLVLAQRLVRRLCAACKKPATAGGPLGALPASEAAILEGAVCYEPTGCHDCAHTGYRGRRGVFEALVVNDKLEERIASGTSIAEIKELALAQGMRTLRQSGLHLVAAGETSLDEILAATIGDGALS